MLVLAGDVFFDCLVLSGGSGAAVLPLLDLTTIRVTLPKTSRHFSGS